MSNLFQNIWNVFGYGYPGLGRTSTAMQKAVWGISLPPEVNLALGLGSQLGGGMVLGWAALAPMIGVSAAGVTGAGLAGAAPAVIPLIKTGAEIGFDIYILEWLKKNWWIPALFAGGLIAYKLIK